MRMQIYFIFVAAIWSNNSCFPQRWLKGYVVLNESDTIQSYVLKNWKGISVPEERPISFRCRTVDDYLESASLNSLVAFCIGNEIYRKLQVSWFKFDTVYIPDSYLTAKDSTIPSFSDDYNLSEFTREKKVTISKLHGKIDREYLYSEKFAHLLLSTTYFDLYETGFDKERFYFSFVDNNPQGLELSQYVVATPHKGCRLYNDYKQYFKTLYESLKNRHLLTKANKRSESDFMDLVDTSELEETALIELVKRLDRLRGGKVLYQYW